jgi:hypothetical protein
MALYPETPEGFIASTVPRINKNWELPQYSVVDSFARISQAPLNDSTICDKLR